MIPLIKELEEYINEDSNNLVTILPEIVSSIEQYLATYPSQVRNVIYKITVKVKFVWNQLKVILKDIRKRNKLHGRHIKAPNAVN